MAFRVQVNENIASRFGEARKGAASHSASLWGFPQSAWPQAAPGLTLRPGALLERSLGQRVRVCRLGNEGVQVVGSPRVRTVSMLTGAEGVLPVGSFPPVPASA